MVFTGDLKTMSIPTTSRILPSLLRTSARSAVVPAILSSRSAASSHGQESFEAFTARYVSFFQSAPDLFEVQRGLNNCFAHDLVPAPSVIEAALRAARRVDDYATAVRIFEGIKEKVENKGQYDQYVEELKTVREELGVWICQGLLDPYSNAVAGIVLKEELYSQ